MAQVTMIFLKRFSLMFPLSLVEVFKALRFAPLVRHFISALALIWSAEQIALNWKE